MTLGRRAWMFVLAVVLSAAPVLTCGGWSTVPDSRMACCKVAVSCRMAAHGSHSLTATHNPTQAAADACCAASSGHSSTTSATSTIVAALVVVQHPSPAPLAVTATRGGVRERGPMMGADVPKHLLLSVFLL